MTTLATKRGDLISVHVKPPRHCHKLVRDTAKAMAAEIYEELASKDNLFYKRWPRERIFIEKKWGLFVDDARTTLAQMLGGALDDGLKKTIADALILDNQFRNHQRRA